MQIKPVTKDIRKENLASVAIAGSATDAPAIQDAQGLGTMMQRLANTRQELLASLDNSLKAHAYEVSQSDTMWGKLMSLFVQPNDPEWIEIDGTRLIQLYLLAAAEPPLKLSASKIYSAEVAGLRSMLRNVKPGGKPPMIVAD